MALSIGKRDVTRIAKVLDQDYETVEDAARAVLEAAFELYESKAKFTVVGQMYYAPDGGWLDKDDAAASKVALGRYGTEIQARDAAESLTISGPTGEQFLAWVLPVFHGTPHAYFKARAEERKRAEATHGTDRERALQRRIDWFKANPGALTLPPDIDDDIEYCASCGQRMDREES